jgi:predicted small secreted protein
MRRLSLILTASLLTLTGCNTELVVGRAVDTLEIAQGLLAGYIGV